MPCLRPERGDAGRGPTKACRVENWPAAREALRREIHVHERLSGDFMPSFAAAEDDEDGLGLVIEDLSSYHWPPPRGGRRIEIVLARLDALHHTKASLDTYARVHGATGSDWRAVAEEPLPFLGLGPADAGWLRAALPTLVEVEERCPGLRGRWAYHL